MGDDHDIITYWSFILFVHLHPTLTRILSQVFDVEAA